MKVMHVISQQLISYLNHFTFDFNKVHLRHWKRSLVSHLI